MALKPVTDPGLLQQLESGATTHAAEGLKPVTDPALIQQLDAGPAHEQSFAEGWQKDPLRQTALVGRAAAEGVANAASMFDLRQQLVIPVVNLALEKLGFTPLEQSGINTALKKGLDAAGAYNPETSGEQMQSAVTRGVTGALTTAGIGGASGAANAVRAGVSGATGAGASELVRQHGGGPLAQVGAGIVGGLAPAAVEGTARLAAQVAQGAIRPLTRSGQEAMAAQLLKDQARDPQAAAANLDAAQSVVPGSARTTGEASQDVGLLALEKGVRGKNTAAFGERLSEQNAARQAELQNLAGTPQDIGVASRARDAATTPMREMALGAGQGTVPAPTQAVHDTIDTILASPAGKRETISKAMQWAREQIGNESDPAALYEIRKDLQLAQRGKLQPSSPNAPNASVLAQARGELGDVVKSLDDAIESAAPGFKAYLERYKEMSQPIDQMKIIQEIQRRAQLTSADVTTGQNFIGNAGFSRALDAALQKNGTKLTQDQVQRLEAIRTDLQYGQAINSPLVKAPGSDTFQNLSIAQVLGAGPEGAHPALRVLSKPLTWVYKLAGSDEKVNEILANAMLDPKLASQMLKRATPTTMAQFSKALKQSGAASALGAAGSTAQVLPSAPSLRDSRQGSQPATR